MGNEIQLYLNYRDYKQAKHRERKVGSQRKSGAVNKRVNVARRLDWQLSSSPSVQKQVEGHQMGW